MYVIIYGIAAIIILGMILGIFPGLFAFFAAVLAVGLSVLIIMRNNNIKKQNTPDYDENALIIQNVKAGGIIKLAYLDGHEGEISLKVQSRNLYTEGDFYWYELECINNEGEKIWIDVEDDDKLTVSAVITKPAASELVFADSLKNIDENERGKVYYKNKYYAYKDSGEAIFYKHCDDRKKERLYYWDFRNGNYMISVEEWANDNGKKDMEYYYSQILPPSSITVYSINGGTKNE